MSTQPKPRRLPPQAPSNPTLAAALQQRSAPVAQAASASPAGPSSSTPTAVGSVPSGTTPVTLVQGTPVEQPSVTSAPPAPTTVDAPSTSQTAPLPIDIPSPDIPLHTQTKPLMSDEVDRLVMAFKAAALRAGDIMRFQNNVRRLGVTQFVTQAPYALSSCLAREVDRFDEACDEIEAALLKSYGLIYAEIQRRKEAEHAALLPPPRVSSRAATTPPLTATGPLLSQPTSPRPATSDRPHPPPLNTRLPDYPQRPSAFPRPSAVHLSALPASTLAPGPSAPQQGADGFPPGTGRLHNHPGLSLDLSSTKLFGLQPELVSPVTLAPKRAGAAQSPTGQMLPPELLSALQGVGGMVDLSTIQALQMQMQVPQLQMSPHAMALQLQMSPHQSQSQLPVHGRGLMSPARIEHEQLGMGIDYFRPPQEGSRPGSSGAGELGPVQGGGIEGMDLDFLDMPGPVPPMSEAREEVGVSGVPGLGNYEPRKDGAGINILASLGEAPPQPETGALPSEQAEAQPEGLEDLASIDFSIPGLEDGEFAQDGSGLTGTGGGDIRGVEGDINFDLDDFPELNFPGLGEGEVDFEGLGDLEGLGLRGGMESMDRGGAGMALGEEVDFGALGAEVDFASLLGGTEAPSVNPGTEGGQPTQAVPKKDTGMDDDGMIDLDGRMDFDDLWD